MSSLTATTTTTATNLGPFTTPFTYPASCSVVIKNCVTCDGGFQAQTCGDNAFNTQGLQDDPSCWPPRSDNDAISTGVALNGWGYYSPAIECPVGLTTACVATAGVNGGFPFQFPPSAGETVFGCCPPGYNCNYQPGIDGAQTCVQVVSTGSLPTVQCSSGTSLAYSFITLPATVTSPVTVGATRVSTATVVLSRVTVLAPLIQLVHRAVDLSSTSSTGSVQPSATTTRHPSSSSVSLGGLSTGAAAGIGVGVGLAVVLAIVALAWFVVAGRRKKRQAAADGAGSPGDKYHAELPSSHTGVSGSGIGPWGNAVEMSGDIRPAELSGNHAVELPASTERLQAPDR
ncbi:hypothetical protein VTK73DRAFT_8007 [Phialemonium thermophilum]|uniref:Uncharacterized protein n=1 Tax=Phialemonium thermophilum TaxID=223376 RepID=A0ABR3XRH7_9PEZI